MNSRAYYFVDLKERSCEAEIRKIAEEGEIIVSNLRLQNSIFAPQCKTQYQEQKQMLVK